MIKSSKSLTAIIDIKFHYKEPETKPVDQGSELEPKMQEILVKFANYLNHLARKQTSRALHQLGGQAILLFILMMGLYSTQL